MIKLDPTGEVHPVADLFPMMTDDELDDLAADIKENGLLHPIVLDANGMLIDGRNRLAACQRAKVKPAYSSLNGHDPVAFIIASNVSRRHLTKGQQAMAIARARILSTKWTVRDAAEGLSISKSRVHQAVTVLDYAPDLADAVLSGATPLNTAYEEARERKEAAMSDEAKFERLRAESSELAVKVQEGELTLAGALAEAAERRQQEERKAQEERDRLERLTRQLDTTLNYLDPRSIPLDDYARQWLAVNPAVIGDHADFSAARARLAAEVLLRYAELKENEENG